MKSSWRVLVLGWLVLLAGAVSGQNNRANQYYELDIKFGKSLYSGDVTSEAGFTDSKTGSFALGVGVSRKISPRLKANLGINWLRIHGSDAELSAAGSFNYNRNLNFRNDIWEVSATGAYYLIKQNGHYSERKRVLPYLTAGFALFHHNPKGKTPGQFGNVWVPLQPLGTEGQGRTGFDSKYGLIGWAIPLGFGVDFKLSERLNLTVHSEYRITNTDYLDDIGGNYAGANAFADNELAALMADRSQEPTDAYSGAVRTQIPALPMEAGQSRGSKSGNDGYMFAGFKLGYILTRSKNKKELSRIHQIDVLPSPDTLAKIQPKVPDYSDRIKVRSLAMNTKHHEMQPSYYKGGIAYVSDKKDRKHFARKNRSKYYNFFYSPIHDVFKNELQNPIDIPNPKYREYHHYGAVRLENSDRMIVEMYEDTKAGDDIATHKLYWAHGYAESVIDSLKPLPFNNSDYSVAQPTITESGTTFIFASDMEGGLGGTDLYVSYNIDGNWTYPKNLGAPINTPGDEMFPYFHVDSTFYFASDGHPGAGGLDIFEVIFNENGNVKEIANLGMPINSPGDDFSIIMDDYKRKGFFTSNRKGGKGGHDLYEFDVFSLDISRKLTAISEEMIPKVKLDLKGEVWNHKTRKPLKGAIVRLRNIIEDDYMIVRSSEKGEFTFEIENDAIYEITATALGFEHMENRIISTIGIADNEPMESILDMDPIVHYLNIKGIIRDEDSKLPVLDASITLYDLTDDEQQESTTDSEGNYVLELEQDKKFKVVIEKAGYERKEFEVSTVNQRKSQTRTFYIELFKSEKGK